MLRGLIVWHHYQNGDLINCSQDYFKGSFEGLQLVINNNQNENEKLRNVRHSIILIFHAFIPVLNGE